MEKDVFRSLYEVVQQRKVEPQEGSYTSYLFEKGIDKILKKIGEESAETIIAAKGTNKVLLRDEICDLLYHIIVMMVECEMPLEAITDELARRSKKIGNFKNMKEIDKNT
ncbi:MAG: phosphoribosyl-ATP diphosphatase [Clostridiales bacterium]|nr:phosphoribosyl-ATP diphosphatase [Clostridiales bacterium]